MRARTKPVMIDKSARFRGERIARENGLARHWFCNRPDRFSADARELPWGKQDFALHPLGPERQLDQGVELTRKIALDDHDSESAMCGLYHGGAAAFDPIELAPTAVRPGEQAARNSN